MFESLAAAAILKAMTRFFDKTWLQGYKSSLNFADPDRINETVKAIQIKFLGTDMIGAKNLELRASY